MANTSGKSTCPLTHDQPA